MKYPSLIIKAADPGIAYSKIWKWKTKFGRFFDKLYRNITISSKEASRIIVQLANTDKFDNDPNILYSYNKPRKLPKRVKNDTLRNQVLESTEKIVSQYI
jgi:hypothetical protein